MTPDWIIIRVQWQKHRKGLRIPILESQPRLNPMIALNHSSEAYCLPKTSLVSEFKIIQLPRADSTPDQMPFNVATLSITTHISRRTSSNSRNCYMTLFSFSSRATLQLSKPLKITIDHPSSAPILTILIRFQRLQESIDSNRIVKDIHLSKFTPPPLSGTNTPPSLYEKMGQFLNP